MKGSTMSGYMTPVVKTLGTVIERLETASNAITTSGGGVTGETYLTVNEGGNLVYGQDQTPLHDGHRFAVGLHSFAHGWIDADRTNKVRDRVVVPMVENPVRPEPPGGS